MHVVQSTFSFMEMSIFYVPVKLGAVHCSSYVQKSYRRKTFLWFYSKFILSVSNSNEKLGEAMPNVKYGDMLHPHASKKYLHLLNYILWLSHTHRCELVTMSGNSDLALGIFFQNHESAHCHWNWTCRKMFSFFNLEFTEEEFWVPYIPFW